VQCLVTEIEVVPMRMTQWSIMHIVTISVQYRLLILPANYITAKGVRPISRKWVAKPGGVSVAEDFILLGLRDELSFF